MKYPNKLKYFFIAVLSLTLFTQCKDNDDDDDDDPVENGFAGEFIQEDIMGRPGVNTVFAGSDMVKNDFNASLVTDRAAFQPIFQETLELYHDVYGDAIGAELDYEANILGLDAATFTTVLAQFDALQVAPEGQTVYYDGVTGVALTGRGLEDDVIDISLTLSFGGETGARFDGNDGTPQLTSDGVDKGDRMYTDFFPYLENPN